MSPRPTTDRRSAILDGALSAFLRLGYEATTVEDIRLESGASIGSIYHHFAGKESIAAELYVQALAHYQRGLAVVFAENASARAGVAAIVRHHLDWVWANKEEAEFLLAHREPELLERSRVAVEDLNQAFLAEVRKWFRARVADGQLRPMPLQVQLAMVLGPLQEFGRAALRSGRRPRTRDVDALQASIVRSLAA